jgi:hypothetical protein
VHQVKPYRPRFLGQQVLQVLLEKMALQALQAPLVKSAQSVQWVLKVHLVKTDLQDPTALKVLKEKMEFLDPRELLARTVFPELRANKLGHRDQLAPMELTVELVYLGKMVSTAYQVLQAKTERMVLQDLQVCKILFNLKTMPNISNNDTFFFFLISYLRHVNITQVLREMMANLGRMVHRVRLVKKEKQDLKDRKANPGLLAHKGFLAPSEK